MLNRTRSTTPASAPDPVTDRLTELAAADPGLAAIAETRMDGFLAGDDQALDVTATHAEHLDRLAGPATVELAAALADLEAAAGPYLAATARVAAALTEWATRTTRHGLTDTAYDAALPATAAGHALDRLADLRAAVDPR